ncbi:MAG: agmatine deiminase family protein [Bacteroidota bacterium]
MKKIMSISMLLICTLCIFTACQKETMEEGTDNLQTATRASEDSMNKNSDNKSLVVLSAPSVYNNYYASIFDDIIEYQANFANLVSGNDEVVILADAATLPYFDGKVPASMLLEADIEDIWIRDFAPVHPTKQVKFNYLPYFQSASTSNFIDNSFEDWFYAAGLSYGKKSNLILDGGNVVDNGKNKVIVTDRFLWDNPQLTKNAAKKKLKKLLGVKQVAIIPEFPGDATGHADGMVMWASSNKILLHELPNSIRKKTIKELKKSFPGVKIVEVPDYYEDETWQGFSSACNIFVNSLVTDDFIYMPTFDSPYDTEMIDLFEAHTNKTVIPVPAESVCFMGGSVRCLSWQMKGSNANIILNLAEGN